MDTRAVFKAYDVRGTYPDQLNEELARALGSAFATFIDRPSLVMARDMRESGVALSRAFAEGARSRGVSVTDLGLASTDLLYFASGHLDEPGVMFTASHNPARYNGVKFCGPGASPVGSTSGLDEIERLTRHYLDQPAYGPLAPLASRDLTAEWVAHVHSFIDRSALRPLRVVADVANAMGALVAPAVFAGLPFDLEVLYGDLDGSFPHHPADPLNPANLVDLQRRVLATGADVGLAFDGDADRVFLIDERARPVSGSTTMALVASVILQRHRGATVLYNLICSRAVPEVIDECGGVAVRTRVGHSFIKQVMAETGAVFGGEHSGHYYYRDNYRADSGIITALLVLEALARAERPLSSLVAPFERYASSGEVNVAVPDAPAAAARLAAYWGARSAALEEVDGLSVTTDDAWFNVRPSNTEPLVRVNVEARDAARCAATLAEVVAVLDPTSEAVR
ncbi:MAG: phosphomannomutase/phosphoglucomutase [Acidimicrobiales bacterium]